MSRCPREKRNDFFRAHPSSFLPAAVASYSRSARREFHCLVQQRERAIEVGHRACRDRTLMEMSLARRQRRSQRMVRDNGAERIGHAVASGERREVTTNREIPTRHCSRKGAPGGDGGRARVQCRTKGGRPLWTSERVAVGTIRRRETKATAAFPFPIASINLCVRMRAEPEEAPWRRLQIPLRGRNSAAAPPPAYLVPLRKLPACTRVYFCL